jgi:hypothetical protein
VAESRSGFRQLCAVTLCHECIPEIPPFVVWQDVMPY